jgi:hypothetical protein
MLFDITAQTAWLLKRKLLEAMAVARRGPLESLVEVNHTKIPLRFIRSFSNTEDGAINVVVALEVRSHHIRLAVVPDDSPESLQSFVRANVKRGATLLTNGHQSYLALSDYRHDSRGFGKALRRTERSLRVAKSWLGRYEGIGRADIDDCFADYVFNNNNEFAPRRLSFEDLLRPAPNHQPSKNYWTIVGRDNPRKGNPIIRRRPRRRMTATGLREDGAGRRKI